MSRSEREPSFSERLDRGHFRSSIRLIGLNRYTLDFVVQPFSPECRLFVGTCWVKRGVDGKQLEGVIKGAGR